MTPAQNPSDVKKERRKNGKTLVLKTHGKEQSHEQNEMKRLAVSVTCLLITFASLFTGEQGDSPDSLEHFRLRRERVGNQEILPVTYPIPKGFIKTVCSKDTKGRNTASFM